LIADSADWYCATALIPQKVNTHGFGRYGAQDYDDLVDCPVEMGPSERALHGLRRAAPHRGGGAPV
jgi:predicted metalloprotease with PDZ domain